MFKYLKSVQLLKRKYIFSIRLLILGYFDDLYVKLYGEWNDLCVRVKIIGVARRYYVANVRSVERFLNH